MAKKFRFDESGDCDDLQALFDSIAAQTSKSRLEVTQDAGEVGDSDELQALFDQVSGASCPADDVTSEQPIVSKVEAAGGQETTDGEQREQVFQRVGQMARQLHDMLRTLGLDRMLEETARAIPDARQRLNYIAEMTEQAASRVLNATDIAKPIQEGLQTKADALSQKWDRLYRNEMAVDEFKLLAGETRDFLKNVPAQTRSTNEQLMEIMMAQDFQDLTGQVIKKVVEMAQRLEAELVHLLVDVVPEERRPAAEGLLNGPVINPNNRGDVVADQGQVDELLESLGF
jgi:chemotaxis protein CheZ